jgi:CHRD domain
MRRTIALLALAVIAAVTVTAVAVGQRPGSSNRSFFAALSGGNELTAENARGGGDRNGFGSAAVTIDGTRLCWGLTVKNLDAPQAAHIHRGGPRSNGSVVVPLSAPESGDPGATSGCGAVSATLARQIARSPGRYYVNVHNQAFPGGAVRGQLRSIAPNAR